MIEAAFNALPDIIASHGRHRPQAKALISEAGAWTWAELDRRIQSAATLLHEAHVQRGNRIALLSTNRGEAYVAALAALRAGAVAVPISPLLTPVQIGAILEDANPAAIFVDPILESLFTAAQAVSAASYNTKVISLDALPDSAAGAEVPLPTLTPQDFATIIYSSGTTGAPKGILHTHQARLMHAAGLAVEFSIGDRAVTLLATPLHTNGTWMMALPTLAMGGCCMLMSRFTAKEAIRCLAESGVTHMFAVPTMLGAMHQELSAAPRAFPDLVMCISAGSALVPELKQAMHSMLGGRLGELYGLTEGVATVLKPNEMLAHLDSVGRPGGGVEFVILDEQGNQVPAGEIGEITGRSSGLMRGYYNRPALTEQLLWRDGRDRVFIRTGDMGRFDQEGYLHIVDRKRDMIVSGGLNVFSADLEAAVRAHPCVADVAVIGFPHPKWGEAPAAIVRLNSDANLDAIAEFANDRLAKHQRIARILLREQDFPRNLLGKVLKRELREEYGPLLVS